MVIIGNSVENDDNVGSCLEIIMFTTLQYLYDIFMSNLHHIYIYSHIGMYRSKYIILIQVKRLMNYSILTMS